MSVEFGRPSWPTFESSSRRFGQGRWSFEDCGQRYIKEDVIPVDKAVGVNLHILYSLERNGLGISVMTNVPPLFWSPEIETAVFQQLKIKDSSGVDVRKDPSVPLVRLDLKKHSNISSNHSLLYHR